MRTKSIFGVKSITNLIYGLLMIAPFVAILSRVIYTQSNPNARDSYSSELVSKTSLLSASNYESLYVDNQIITTYYDSNLIFSSQSGIFGFKEITLDLNTLLNTQNVVYNGFRFYTNTNTLMKFYDVNNNEYTLLNANDTIGNFTYVVDLSTYNQNANKQIYRFRNATVITYTTENLDNAFEYSLLSFTKDNDIGVIDFFGWFEGMFLNQSNAHNMVYLNFANWYMNYALLVSSSYLLFLALIWFVNYIRRILDKSMNHDFGGF